MKLVIRRSILVTVGTLGLCSLTVPYAWRRYEAEQLRRSVEAQASASLREIFESDRVLTESVMESPDSMTFNELLRNCEKAIDKRGDLIARIRALPSNFFNSERKDVANHMKEMNELVRVKGNLLTQLLHLQSLAHGHRANFARFQASYSG